MAGNGKPKVRESLGAGPSGKVDRSLGKIDLPSPATVLSERQARLKMAAVARRQDYFRRKADRDLKKSLNDEDVLVNDSRALKPAEKDLYQKIIFKAAEEADDNAVDLNETVIRDIFSPKKFKEKYAQWHSEFQLQSSDYKAANSEEDYIIEQATVFINEQRDLIISQQTQKTVEGMGVKDLEKSQKIEKAVFAFVDQHEADLLLYPNLKKEKQAALFSQFLQIFLNNGCQPDQKSSVENLFFQIVNNVNFAVDANTDFAQSLNLMRQMVSDPNMTDEQWKQQLNLFFEQNKPKPDEPAQLAVELSSVGDSGNVPVDSVDYSSQVLGTVTDSAKGVSFQPDPARPGIYNVKFDLPSIQNQYSPLVEVYVPAGSKNPLEDAVLYMQENWYQEGVDTRSKMGQLPAKPYKPNEFKMALNSHILQYQAFEHLKYTQVNPGGAVDVANLSKDINRADLQILAEGLLGFSLNERVLQQKDIELFQRFLIVLLNKGKVEKPIEAGETGIDLSTIAGRVKYLKNIFLEPKDQRVQHIREILRYESSVSLTFDGLITEVDDRVAGRKASGVPII